MLSHVHRQGWQYRTAMAPPSTTSLFGTANDNANDDDRQRNGRNGLKVMVQRVRAAFVRAYTKYSSLSRRMKRIVLAQLVGLSILLVSFVGLQHTRSVRMAAVPKPVEVPFSQFMDFVERKDPSGTLPGGAENIHVANVRIGVDRIGYQVLQGVTDEEKKAVQLLRKGVHPTVPIPARQAYTRKIPSSLEFINYLRDNNIPFTAAAPSSTTSFVTVALRSFLMVFYILILARMYTMYRGGGAGDNGPGTLAKPSATSKFEDIQGIDGAKYEVMELVDTLRNPNKYAILGARAPKGLLLEGPPGTGKVRMRGVYRPPDG